MRFGQSNLTLLRYTYVNHQLITAHPGLKVEKVRKHTIVIPSYSKFKHFVPLKCVVSVEHPFVGPRKSMEEVFFVHQKMILLATTLQYFWIYSLGLAGLT